VVTLTNKAFDLEHAGHLARSVEYGGRAIAAAQALGVEDCLIVAKLQLYTVASLYNVAVVHMNQRAPGEPPFAPVVLLFFDAAATLQRRKAAGTLLAGSCRAAEVEWQRLTDEHTAEVRQDDNMRNCSPKMAPLVGYVAFMTAASLAYNVILLANRGLLSVRQEQLRSCVELMADAAELMMQPRIHEDCFMGEEGEFVQSMRKLVTHPELILPHGAVGARLLDNWRCLEQSGVLQRRCCDEVIQSTKLLNDAVNSAAAAAAAAPGLRTCALVSCGAREAHLAHFKSCAACRCSAYCCKEHQTADWPSHKAACKAARKAAEKKNTG
jgi:hypothetical protein